MKKIINILFVLFLLFLNSCAKSREVVIIELNVTNEFTTCLNYRALAPEVGEIIEPASSIFDNNQVIFSNLPNCDILFICETREESYAGQVHGWHWVKSEELPCKFKFSKLIPSNLVNILLYNIPENYKWLRMYRVLYGKIDKFFRKWEHLTNGETDLYDYSRDEYIIVAMCDSEKANPDLPNRLDIGYMKINLKTTTESKIKIPWKETVLSSAEKKFVSEHFKSDTSKWNFSCAIVYTYLETNKFIDYSEIEAIE